MQYYTEQCYTDQYYVEFSQKIKEINRWYQLFSSFEDYEICTERRDIILENLLYQFKIAEQKYQQEQAEAAQRKKTV